MQNKRQLLIDGDDVTFALKESGQAMAVPKGGRTERPQPFLSAAIERHGERVWSGVISHDVTLAKPIEEQFSDRDLERLFRQARASL